MLKYFALLLLVFPKDAISKYLHCYKGVTSINGGRQFDSVYQVPCMHHSTSSIGAELHAFLCYSIMLKKHPLCRMLSLCALSWHDSLAEHALQIGIVYLTDLTLVLDPLSIYLRGMLSANNLLSPSKFVHLDYAF